MQITQATFRLLAMFAIFCAAAFPQVDTGAISGIVTDSSGATIPAAEVTITQVETGVRVPLQTNEAGFYSAPALHPGHYNVAVVREGFQAQRKTGVELRVQDRLEMNFTLTIGAATTEVTVEAAAPLLESETSSLGQVIHEKTITDLPLNGRSFIQLATLTAGTLPSTRTQERDNFISNGARAVQNSYLLDGIDNKNRILGFDRNSAQIIQPVIDGIEEFKVQTATFSAEFGQAAGGVVNVTLKSGTNSFHGNVFEFLRNSKLDATPYFQPPSTGRALFIQNQFGATFGGPIIKNKTFFFGSWQSSREGNAAPQLASVPTAAERQGVFPSKVIDPATGASFPNNTIPQNRWDSVAAGLFALYPLPNLPGAVNNYSYNPKEIVNSDTYSVKVDHHFGANDYLFGRISQGWGDVNLPTLLPDPANTQGTTSLGQRQFVLSETHTVASNKVNEFRLGFVYTLETADVFGERLFDKYGIKGAFDDPSIKGLPTFTITGLSQLGTPTTLGNAPIPASGSGNRPVVKSGKLWQLLDNFSWIHDRHTIKFGVDFARTTEFAKATNSARPGFTFNGTYTGSPLADFLLGDVYTASTAQPQIITIQQYVYNGYVQDDWKVNSKLTVNLGLRYELPTPFFEAHDRQSNFVLDAGPCYLQLITVAQRSQCHAGIGRTMVRLDTNNFAPRLGLAYQVTHKTVVRSGFGVFYGRDENYGISARLPANPPWVASATFPGSTTAPAFLLSDGLPAGALNLSGVAGFNANTTVYSQPFNFPVSYVEQWNLNIEHQLPGSLVAQVGYTGSGAHKLLMPINVNQALPGSGAVNARRPYPGVGNITYYAPLDNSTYQALVSKVERRFSKGLSLLASYTFGHSIDGGGNEHDTGDVTPQDVRNLAAQKGSSNFDVRHRFVFSGFYQLPFGKSKGFRSQLIRGWQLSGIFSAQTGQPFTATLTTDPSGTSTTARPNRIADGNLPSSERSPTHWFDTTAFVAPNCICFGNSGRDILRGPGFINLDLSIIRDFIFAERFRLQFRAESFNLMNHPNFGLPNSVLGNPSVGIITSTIKSGAAEPVGPQAVFLIWSDLYSGSPPQISS
jgi:Carboxypeptidase regulatory-like domain/TonB dependent receptor